ncbi:putative IS1595 family protein [Octadecabacter antarcticus 307]|uniref:Putative IS1595 family protein n=1 Tax=Octadecabacter antarcticus 307 TaxID=391626 RepID=M9RB53_9RHOB|nr:IS1595 family transposase [Octadecabacter antarcticus]AGI67631.1 putative IS1595 family protein [Octadecabacter antarcticus 307]
MPARWKNDKPMSRPAFDARFSDEEACSHYLSEHRWPEGFVCPSCGTCKGWPLKRNRATWECAGCARQTSVTAGTVMHSSHLPLRIWFLAAHIITSHSNGMSALQLQAQLGLGSYKTAWLLLQKLRRSMVNPDRNPLKDLVEIDETEMPFRSRHDPKDRPKGGRSPVGKMFVVCAVELSSDGHPRRIRMKHIPNGASKTLHGFIDQAVEPGAHIITDGWLGYENPPANTHEAKVVSGKKAHDILHWVHRVFSNLKTWAKGVFHGLRKCHLQRYLDEFVFRWNRRRHMRSAFDTLLGIGVGLGPATYRDFVEQRA